MPLSSGKGQILWTEKMTHQSTFFNDVFTAYLSLPIFQTRQLKINCKYTAIKRWFTTKLS